MHTVVANELRCLEAKIQTKTCMSKNHSVHFKWGKCQKMYSIIHFKHCTSDCKLRPRQQVIRETPSPRLYLCGSDMSQDQDCNFGFYTISAFFVWHFANCKVYWYYIFFNVKCKKISCRRFEISQRDTQQGSWVVERADKTNMLIFIYLPSAHWKAVL